jgi:hypothetical protein
VATLVKSRVPRPCSNLHPRSQSQFMHVTRPSNCQIWVEWSGRRLVSVVCLAIAICPIQPAVTRTNAGGRVVRFRFDNCATGATSGPRSVVALSDLGPRSWGTNAIQHDACIDTMCGSTCAYYTAIPHHRPFCAVTDSPFRVLRG